MIVCRLSAARRALLLAAFAVWPTTLWQTAGWSDPPTSAAEKTVTAAEKAAAPEEPPKAKPAEPATPAAGATTPAAQESASKPADNKPADNKTADDKPEEKTKVTAKVKTPLPPSAPVTSARELLELVGADPSYFDNLVDGEPIGESEAEALLRVLIAVRRLDLLQLDALLERPGSWQGDLREPKQSRGSILPLSGRVTSISIEKPVPQNAERFELEQYYRCQFQLDGPLAAKADGPVAGKADGPAEGQAGPTATVYTLSIPAAWKKQLEAGQPIDEPAGAKAFFLKLEGADAEPKPVFVAQRIAWFPDDALGKLRMDVGLFDEVRNAAPLVAEDRECFYQLLAATGRAPQSELDRQTPGKFQLAAVAPLFNDSIAQKGKLVKVAGHARRAILVRVDDRDVVKRFGLDHYYEVEVFTGDADKNGNPLVFVFCVRDLPAGMPVGENIIEMVEATGVFMKIWTYKVKPNEEQQAEKIAASRQLAPLLISHSLNWTPPKADPYAGLFTGLVFASVLAAFAVMAWRYRRSDRKFGDRMQARQRSQEPDPDFSGRS